MDRMDQKKRERNRCLLLWIGSLPIFSNSNPRNDDFKDGIISARILKDVIDPEYFNDLNDSPKESTELVKIVEKMKKYLTRQTGHPVSSNLVPNIGKIISLGDIGEINRLLQFILSCAVNSQRKENFVTKIMEMEETVQFDIMEAIQEMFQKEESIDSLDIDIRIPARSEIASLNDIIEQLSQQNHDFKVKISQLTEEKMALLSENERLSSQLTSHLNDPESIHVSLKHSEELKKECERLREENYRLESTSDDYKLRIGVIEKQLIDGQKALALSQSYQSEALKNKDELDSLREAAARVPQLENTIQLYKKKLEGLEFHKRTIKDLEEQNEKLHKVNISLEDQVSKADTWKNQVENLKKKLIETQQSFSQETQKVRRLDFELDRTRQKIESVQALADRLQDEKTTLNSQLDELRLNPGLTELGALHQDSVNSIDLVPTSARQRITRLELENAELKKKVNSGILIGSDEGSRVIVEELRKREAELDEELLKKTQDLVDLRSSSDEKIHRLESILLAKEEELKKKENQYKKCMDKAKSVIVTLEPTAAGTLDPHSSSPKSDAEGDKQRAVREMEEKLLASAFYNYGITLHRNAVENRNSTLLQKSRSNIHPSSRRRSEF